MRHWFLAQGSPFSRITRLPILAAGLQTSSGNVRLWRHPGAQSSRGSREAAGAAGGTAGRTAGSGCRANRRGERGVNALHAAGPAGGAAHPVGPRSHALQNLEPFPADDTAILVQRHRVYPPHRPHRASHTLLGIPCGKASSVVTTVAQLRHRQSSDPHVGTGCSLPPQVPQRPASACPGWPLMCLPHPLVARRTLGHDGHPPGTCPRQVEALLRWAPPGAAG